MAITRAKIVEAIHLGTKAANKKYESWSKGWWVTDAGVEGLLAACIAETINKRQGANEHLMMETQFGYIAEKAGASLPDAVGGASRVDIVLLNRNEAPICVIEVKRKWNKESCLNDLNRIDALIGELSYRNNGSLRRGFLTLMIDKKATRNMTANDRIKGQKESIREIISESFETHYQNKIRYILGKSIPLRETYRQFYGDWAFAPLCIEIYAPNS